MTVLGAWGLCSSVHPTEFLLLRRDVGRWLGRHGGGELDPECMSGQGGSLVCVPRLFLPPPTQVGGTYTGCWREECEVGGDASRDKVEDTVLSGVGFGLLFVISLQVGRF